MSESEYTYFVNTKNCANVVISESPTFDTVATTYDTSNAVVSNGYYTTCNLGSTKTWASIGASLATPEYVVVCQKNKPITRPYYRLHIFLGQLSENLKEKYRTAINNHNKVLDMYKKGNDICFDAGFDLFVPKEYHVRPHMTCKVDHQVQCSMSKVYTNRYSVECVDPVGYYLYPRSSMATKTPLSLANSVGIIDSGYRGNIIGVVHCGRATDEGGDIAVRNFDILSSHRLVQICPPDLSYPVEVVEVDNEDKLGCKSKRGKGGFGSTGV